MGFSGCVSGVVVSGHHLPEAANRVDVSFLVADFPSRMNAEQDEPAAAVSCRAGI
jgi:hypothetical protein